MKYTCKKIFKRTLCAVLALVMLCTLVLNAAAVGTAEGKQYVKDVMLIYAESKQEAKTRLPEGYTLLEHDLNEGTEYVYDVYHVYMAYTTTSDPEEAITDIKLMNMNGGFAYSDYEEQLQNVDQRVRTIADELMIAVGTFKENYVKGTYGAMAAYRALSFFTVDEADGQSLADYMIYGEPTDAFYIKLVLNAHRDIISSILSALTMAVQGEKGDTWLDRLTKIEDPDDIYDSAYWDQACVLWESFNASTARTQPSTTICTERTPTRSSPRAAVRKHPLRIFRIPARAEIWIMRGQRCSTRSPTSALSSTPSATV